MSRFIQAAPCQWVLQRDQDPYDVDTDTLRAALVDVTEERDELLDWLEDERAEHEVTRGMMLALEAKVARLESAAWIIARLEKHMAQLIEVTRTWEDA